jgi:leader peptidase (prepilin peptidase)/N-methyltransferase
MDSVVMALGALAAFAAGWVAAGRQHLLYRQAHYRAEPAHGRRLLLMRAGLAAAAALMAALALRPGHYGLAPSLLSAAFGLALLVLASTDYERRLLPDRLVYPAILAAALFCWAWPDRTPAEILLGAAIGAGAGIVLYLLGLLTGAALHVRLTPFGLGDVKLIVLLGVLLGWPGLLAALVLGVLTAGIPAFVLLARGRARTVFSYGPYLVFGGLIVLLFPNRFL